MKRLLLVIIAIVLCMLAVSCNKKDIDDNSTEEITSEVETTESENTTEEETETEVISNVEWKTPALSVLYEYNENKTAVYYLYDMNSDGVPELLVNYGESGAEKQFVLYNLLNENTVNNGIFLSVSGNSIPCGLDGKKMIMHFGKMGSESISELNFDSEKSTVSVTAIKERELFGEDAEYVELEKIQSYEISDLSGLSWKGNPKDNNETIINSVDWQ